MGLGWGVKIFAARGVRRPRSYEVSGLPAGPMGKRRDADLKEGGAQWPRRGVAKLRWYEAKNDSLLSQQMTSSNLKELNRLFTSRQTQTRHLT